jgi:DNA-binding NarL/FixJ family response regulator
MHPIRLAVVDDYEIVVAGVAHMFDGYGERIEVVELAAGEPVTVDVDVALYDTFAQHEATGADLDVLLANPHARRVAIYTWTFFPSVIRSALDKGVRGYLSKTMPAAALVAALERIHAGEVIVSEPPARRQPVGRDWPGRAEGLSERESEVLSLITQGRSNAEVAQAAYLSINTVKTYIRTAYAKIGVTSRTQAVLWGIEHGLHIDAHRLDDWRQD